MKKKNFMVLSAFLMSLCIAVPVFATPFGAPIGGAPAVYDQQDWPVFIGYSAGQNMGFPLTIYDAGGGTASGFYTSPTYTGLVLTQLIYGYGDGLYPQYPGVGLTPNVAIDLNQSGGVGQPYGPFTLTAFVAGVDTFEYTGTLLQQNTGNGDSDWLLPGLNLAGATSLYFTLDFAGNTNGKENFFLVNANAPPPPPQVPEPATMLLLGIGLIGIGMRKFRK